MKINDSKKAMWRYMLGYIPIFLSAVLYILLGTPPPDEIAITVVSLALVGCIFIVLFRFHPRVQHYMAAINEFDRNYCYAKKIENAVEWTKCTKKPITVEFREVGPDVTGVETLEGFKPCDPAKHYIIRGVRGEVYPIEKGIFNETYEVVEE